MEKRISKNVEFTTVDTSCKSLYDAAGKLICLEYSDSAGGVKEQYFYEEGQLKKVDIFSFSNEADTKSEKRYEYHENGYRIIEVLIAEKLVKDKNSDQGVFFSKVHLYNHLEPDENGYIAVPTPDTWRQVNQATSITEVFTKDGKSTRECCTPLQTNFKSETKRLYLEGYLVEEQQTSDNLFCAKSTYSYEAGLRKEKNIYKLFDNKEYIAFQEKFHYDQDTNLIRKEYLGRFDSKMTL